MVLPALLLAAALPFQPLDPVATSVPPQVFVRDEGQGFRRVRGTDPANGELYNSDGTALLFTLEKWRAATGTVEIVDGEAETKVTLTFRRLIAFGRYSIFLRSGIGEDARFAPLDGADGALDTFNADQDGAAAVTVFTRLPLRSGTVLALVYHSDAQDHGPSPGEFGRTAHQQLLTRIP
jgi:hypothetical protein